MTSFQPAAHTCNDLRPGIPTPFGTPVGLNVNEINRRTHRQKGLHPDTIARRYPRRG